MKMAEKIHILQTKLNSLQQKGVVWTMIDLLQLFDNEVYNTKRPAEEYLSHIMSLQKKYAIDLGGQLTGHKNSSQIDLEDSIREVLTEAKTNL